MVEQRPAVNRDKLQQKSATIRRALGQLKSVSTLSAAQFLANEEKIAASKYHLIIAAEGAIDICNHLVARMAGRAPFSYADCFRILAEERLLEPDLAEKLIKMAKFRNRLIHLYDQIDDAQLYQIICHSLGDIEQFLLYVDTLTRQPTGG